VFVIECCYEEKFTILGGRLFQTFAKKFFLVFVLELCAAPVTPPPPNFDAPPPPKFLVSAGAKRRRG